MQKITEKVHQVLLSTGSKKYNTKGDNHLYYKVYLLHAYVPSTSIKLTYNKKLKQRKHIVMT